jgi:hypothetical protein
LRCWLQLCVPKGARRISDTFWAGPPCPCISLALVACPCISLALVALRHITSRAYSTSRAGLVFVRHAPELSISLADQRSTLKASFESFATHRRTGSFLIPQDGPRLCQCTWHGVIARDARQEVQLRLVQRLGRASRLQSVEWGSS